jgi:pyruvate dehydrogenase E1 component alpha subunit
VRFRTYLTKKGLWSDQDEETVIEEAKTAVNEALAKADAQPKMKVEDLIDSMFERLPADLLAQRAEYAAREGN